MRSVWRRLLGLNDRTVLEDIEFDEQSDTVVAHVRPKSRWKRRCGRCGRRSPGYDAGDGRRRWRGLDLGTVKVVLEADAPRVACRAHGVTVAAVPWARHGARHTRQFDDTVAWLVTQCSKSAAAALMRIAWATAGSIITRVAGEIDADVDRLDGLTRIGIDEISYKRHQHYLTVVVDHDTGRLVWAQPGRDRATLRRFFDTLGEERSARLTHISADGADWIADVAAERAPQAVVCADPFHIVKWATTALEEVRRDLWNHARNQPGGSVRRVELTGPYRLTRGPASLIKQTRWALIKNPEDLTATQQAQLAWIATASPKLHRAYLLKEGLRHVFAIKGDAGKQALDRWLSWAQRSQIEQFVHLARRVKTHLPAIHATLDHGLSNGLVESVNTRIRLLTRIAFGFHRPQPLIALAMLALGGHRPALPGR